MVCILILGGLGSGKTLFMTILAKMIAKPIFSNYALKFSDIAVKPLEIEKLFHSEYQNCCVLMDEAYIYLESRISGSEMNRCLSYVLFQSRKRGVILILTAQLSSSVDVRFRELVDIVIHCEKMGDCYRYQLQLVKEEPIR